MLDFLGKILELVYSKMYIHMLLRMQKHCSSDVFCFKSLTFITFSDIVSVLFFIILLLRLEIMFFIKISSCKL